MREHREKKRTFGLCAEGRTVGTHEWGALKEQRNARRHTLVNKAGKTHTPGLIFLPRIEVRTHTHTHAHTDGYRGVNFVV